MDPLRTLAETDGFFTRAMARDAGYSDRDVDAMHRSGAWLRFRHGAYTFPDLWAVLDDMGRHLVRCRAVLHSLGDVAVLSHVSSVIAHGIDPWGLDLSRVHVTRRDGGAGRVERDVVHHVGRLDDVDVVQVGGLCATVPARAAVEAGALGTGEVALCLFNQLLHAGLFHDDDLCRRFDAMSQWPGTNKLHIPLRMADARVESVGESRGYWLFRLFHVPAPQPQFEVYDTDGVLRGTCDWGWPEHRQLGEFDGAVKYGRLLKRGQQPGDVVFAEKMREDELREISGCGMVRLTWGDYQRPRATAARVLHVLGLAA